MKNGSKTISNYYQKRPKISILISAFGFGSYYKDSENQYKETIKKANEGIERSEVALKNSEEALASMKKTLTKP